MTLSQKAARYRDLHKRQLEVAGVACCVICTLTQLKASDAALAADVRAYLPEITGGDE